MAVVGATIGRPYAFPLGGRWMPEGQTDEGKVKGNGESRSLMLHYFFFLITRK